jgi:hypothetical protein
MAERVQALADQFEQANQDLITFVQGLTDDQWQTMVPNEQRTVGVVLHHLASSHVPVSQAVAMIAAGQSLPVTAELLDQINAAHAQQHAGCTRAETVALLQTTGPAAAAAIRALSDEQLDRSVPMALLGGAPLTAEQFAQGGLLGHIHGHRQSIQAALGG